MLKKISFLLSLLPTTIYIFGQTSTFNDEITQVFPFSNMAVTLTPSWIKDRETLNIQYLKSLNADRLLHNFRVNAGLPSSARPLEGWEAPNIGIRGHFVGHYLSAVSEVVEKYSDTLLFKRLKYMTDELYKCQQAMGEDDENVIAIFYGPMLLAFESQFELVLRSHKEEILQHIAVDNVSQRTFKLTDNGKTYLLRPLFDIDEQSFGVYASIRDY